MNSYHIIVLLSVISIPLCVVITEANSGADDMKTHLLMNRAYCGNDVRWSFDADTGTLTIEGSGNMYDYYDPENIPWHKDYATSILYVDIKQGVTSIARYAFYGCENLINVTISNSVTSIGDSAFSRCSKTMNLTIPNGVNYLGSSVFSDSGFTSITIPASITSMHPAAFIGCNELIFNCSW